jgi:O-antigen/teichoic acid export membrane protein
MSTIRRQSIISSGIVYFGFALGFLNTYLFTRQGGFTQAQYGLTGAFIAIANIMYAFANLGMQAYIYKFYPYYNDNVPPEKNDMVSWSLLVSVSGFIMVMFGGYIFKDLVIRKFTANSPDVVKYYYWIFPFGFGLTMYSLFEAFAWQLKKSILTNYLREIQFRLFTTLLIILWFAGILTRFDIFIKIYAFSYIIIALILLIYLLSTKQIHIVFSISRVSKKFYKKIITLVSFVWGGALVYNIALVFDTIVIAAVMPNGLAFAGVFTLAQNVASLIQAPQRGIISASIAPLSKAWKDKDFEKINRIYHRSSINQLIFSVGMFVLIWINFTDGVFTFHLQKNYLEAQYVFLFLGLIRVIDMGTGLNSQIIGTSTFWRFEFFTGIILLALTLPMNYILTKHIGVTGPAIANLISFSIYNFIRYVFLLKKFNMQPFNIKTLYTLTAGVAGYFICHFLFYQHQGFLWIILRSGTFIALYLFVIINFGLSPDVMPVWKTIKKRMGIKK